LTLFLSTACFLQSIYRQKANEVVNKVSSSIPQGAKDFMSNAKAKGMIASALFSSCPFIPIDI
jgi:hypothetical protein